MAAAEVEVQAPAVSRIEWVIAVPADSAVVAVEEGASLVKLRGSRRLEVKIESLVKRRAAYQDRLDRAQAADKKATMESMQAKVEEKSQAIGEAAKALSSLVVAAERSGDFTPSVKRGAAVKVDDVLGKVVGEPIAAAEFKVKESSPWVKGDEVELSLKEGDKKIVCTVDTSAETVVRVLCSGGYEPGTQVVLPPAAADGL